MMIKKIVNYIKDDKLKIIYFNNSINIINYDNILEIEESNIKISSSNKIIVIKGKSLKLNKLLDRELLITGIINRIDL